MWYSKFPPLPELKGILVSRRSIISVPRRSPACDSCPFRVNSRRTIGSNFPRGIDSLLLPQRLPALPSQTRAPGYSIRESRPGCGPRDSGSRDATCCTTDESDGSRAETISSWQYMKRQNIMSSDNSLRPIFSIYYITKKWSQLSSSSIFCHCLIASKRSLRFRTKVLL